MQPPKIIADKNLKSETIKIKLKKIIKNNTINITNLVFVIGGDGFMLETLKKNKSQNKKFYGINSGNYGFLMNKFSSKDLIKNLKNSRLITISPLEMTVKNRDNKFNKSLAINEVSVLRQSRQTASLSIRSGSKYIIKQLVSDGVLVSTPAGSTAYNLSVHGPILSLNSKKLSIAPISPFRPRRWRARIVNDKYKIFKKNLNFLKNVSAVADNSEFRNIKTILIKKITKLNLIFYMTEIEVYKRKLKLNKLEKKLLIFVS